LRDAAQKTADRAVEFESESLLKESILAIETHLPAEAEAFAANVSMNSAGMTGDADAFQKHAKIAMKKSSGSDDAERLHEMALSIMKKFHVKQELLKLGEKAAKMSIQLRDEVKYNITHATMIYLQGEKQRAISEIDDAIKRHKGEDGDVEKLKEFRNKMSMSSGKDILHHDRT